MFRLQICQYVNRIRIKIFKHKIDKVIVCAELPEIIDDNIIYIMIDEDEYCYLMMKCPCGCGADINLSLIKELTPKWIIRPHIDGTISITPSIWRKWKCKSHFFYKRGKTKWCRS